MSKPPGISTEVFCTTFDIAYAAALRNSEYQETAAWISQEPTWQSGPPPHMVWEYNGFRPNTNIGISTVTYRRWQLADPTQAEHVTENRGATVRPLDVGALTPIASKQRGTTIRRLNIVGVFSTLTPSAPNGDSLNYVIEHAAQWLHGEALRPAIEVRPAIGAIMLRGLQLDPPLFSAENNRLWNCVKSLDRHHPTTPIVNDAVIRFLGHMLLGNFRGFPLDLSKESLDTINPRVALQAIDQAEDMSIMPDNFWIKYGFQNPRIFTEPTTLEALFERLHDPSRNILRGINPINRHTVVARYVNNLLLALRTDTSRDMGTLTQMVTYLEKCRRDDEVLGSIISIANGITPPLNQRFEARGIDITLERLDQRKLANLPAAVTRILYYTIRQTVDPDKLGKMYTYDVMHASNIDQIQALLRETPTQPSAADLRLQRAWGGSAPPERPTLRPRSKGSQRLDTLFSRRLGYGVYS